MSDDPPRYISVDAISANIKRRDEEVDAIVAGPRPPIEAIVWTFAKLDDHLREGGSYRYLIYDRMGFGPEAYVPLFLAGGQNISNAFFDAQYGPWPDMEADLPKVFDFLIFMASMFAWLPPTDGHEWAWCRCMICWEPVIDGCKPDCWGLWARQLCGVA